MARDSRQMRALAVPRVYVDSYSPPDHRRANSYVSALVLYANLDAVPGADRFRRGSAVLHRSFGCR